MSDETDDAAKYAAMRESLSYPNEYSHIFNNSDVLPPEPVPQWEKTYGNEVLFETSDFPEAEWTDDNTEFQPHEDDDGKRGYWVRRRAE